MFNKVHRYLYQSFLKLLVNIDDSDIFGPGLLLMKPRSQDSSAGIATGYRLDYRGV
jgi:hypothetical protein